MHRPTQLNPVETARFREKMAVLPPDHQADVALTWRERFVNVALAHSLGPVGTTVQVATSGVFAGVLGGWDGRNEAARNHAIEIWRTQTASSLGIDPERYPEPFVTIVDPTTGAVLHKAQPDPRNWIGINKTLYPTLTLGLVALGLHAADTGASSMPYIKGAFLTGIGYMVGTSVRDMAYKSHREALRKAAANSSQPTQEGVQAAGNPYRKYPRAA